MEKFKSHFVFNNQQRNGILLLILLIIGLLSVSNYVEFKKEISWDTSSEKIQSIICELDSLSALEIESKKYKIYPFNPNFITDFKGYTLGMTPLEIDRLKKFRSEDNWINSVQEFQNITKISDSLLKKISPYFKFPKWITNPKTNKFKGFKEKSFNEKIDLNLATKEQLQKIRGIGMKLSERILKYRKKIGGFSADIQLYQVYGLDNHVVQRILNDFTVKTPKEIIKMNLNSISASDIATISGISFELAKKIWEFRILRGAVKDFSELEKIEGMTQRKLTVIQLYLAIE